MKSRVILYFVLIRNIRYFLLHRRTIINQKQQKGTLIHNIFLFESISNNNLGPIFGKVYLIFLQQVFSSTKSTIPNNVVPFILPHYLYFLFYLFVVVFITTYPIPVINEIFIQSCEHHLAVFFLTVGEILYNFIFL